MTVIRRCISPRDSILEAVRFLTAILLFGVFATPLSALDPRKSLTQYSRTDWTQESGLPQDTIRAIAQTPNGYLWLGTDEGLARFDGYEFVVFDRASGALPDNSVIALAAARDGSLWIGTQGGLTRYQEGRFRTYTRKDGLPDDSVGGLCADPSGGLWVIAGGSLVRFENGRFTIYPPGDGLPVTAVRNVMVDDSGQLWVAGYSRVVKREGSRFVEVVHPRSMGGTVVLSMIVDRAGTLWLAGNTGLMRRTPDGKLERFGHGDGLPDMVVRAVLSDRDGNLWVGTDNGLARLEHGHFVSAGVADGGQVVRCLLEDREGNLWIGSNGGLSRWRSDIFTDYGKSEGLPSDEPNTVFQDSRGRIWVGFNDIGLMQFGAGGRAYTIREGLPDSEVRQIREGRDGDLLISTRLGLARLSGGRIRTYVPPDPLGRSGVFDALEEPDGSLWLALPGGLKVRRGGKLESIVAGGPLLNDFVVTLCRTRDGAIWAGTYGKGLWRIQGSRKRHYTTADGLSNDQIRSMYEDAEGVLWIATFGGGLDALRGDSIVHYTARDGLLSDNIAKVFDDGESLWLSTTRGICRVPKRQFAEFSAGRRKRLEPENYGVEDGLRSAQCAPTYPVAGGGMRTADGRLWFTTGRGLAVLDPGASKPPVLAPLAHIVAVSANGEEFAPDVPARLAPRYERLQIRYTGVLLGAPERVRYSYILEGFEKNWVNAGQRRVINYNSLTHGPYTFRVRAEVPGSPPTEASWTFVMLPQFWETWWFRLLCVIALAAAAWAAYQMRLRQIRLRFALVLEERARLAREIHDTLAQGFVGISSQLDAVAQSMPEGDSTAHVYLELARRMARHSLTEARRSVMDLRSSALEDQDLAAAIEAGTKQLTAGSGVEVSVEVTGPVKELPPEMEQHLLRIAQEAVTNALKHAQASRIWVKMHLEAKRLFLRIVDNGRGFDQQGAFASRGGHFGLIGMRERAERLGGELRLVSQPGEGTQVEITVPLP
jgi:signal transduction histidine kinase/ligand-binding sensor domain-containing protein